MARIDYADLDDLDPNAQNLIKRLAPLNIFKMMAHNPGILKPFVDLGTAFLFKGSLDPVTRECAILRVGYLSEASYETAQHERIGRDLGMDDALFAALRSGPESKDLTDEQRLAVALTDDVVQNVRASNATFDPVLEHFGPAGAQELVLIIGYYMMVSRFLETFDVDIEAGGAVGLKVLD
ncbi:MAG: carboxymuconolactone decarboxylase family protein [Pseudomonadota bacterium]